MIYLFIVYLLSEGLLLQLTITLWGEGWLRWDGEEPLLEGILDFKTSWVQQQLQQQ